MVRVVLLTLLGLMLAGCDQLGIESATQIAAQREADGKAIGGACRNAGRAIEDCYALNRKAEKAAVYAGWREMNDYMRENKMDVVTPQLTPAPVTEVARASTATDESSDAPTTPAKAVDKTGDKADKTAKPADKTDSRDKAELPVDSPKSGDAKKQAS